MVFLLKSVEDKLGEVGVTQMLEMEDTDKNTALMISVESGSGDSAKVKDSIIVIILKLFLCRYW